jgi:hypothetical protein
MKQERTILAKLAGNNSQPDTNHVLRISTFLEFGEQCHRR